MSDWSAAERDARRRWAWPEFKGYSDGQYLGEFPDAELSDIKRWHRVLGAALGVAVMVPLFAKAAARRVLGRKRDAAP